MADATLNTPYDFDPTGDQASGAPDEISAEDVGSGVASKLDLDVGDVKSGDAGDTRFESELADESDNGKESPADLEATAQVLDDRGDTADVESGALAKDDGAYVAAADAGSFAAGASADDAPIGAPDEHPIAADATGAVVNLERDDGDVASFDALDDAFPPDERADPAAEPANSDPSMLAINMTLDAGLIQGCAVEPLGADPTAERAEQDAAATAPEEPDDTQHDGVVQGLILG